jgi:hypothetical protein
LNKKNEKLCILKNKYTHPLRGGGRGNSGSSIEAAHSTGAGAHQDPMEIFTFHRLIQGYKDITDFFKILKKNII